MRGGDQFGFHQHQVSWPPVVTSDAFFLDSLWRPPRTHSRRSAKPICRKHHPLWFIMKINTEKQQQCVNPPLHPTPTATTTTVLQSNHRGKEGKWVIATHSVSAFVSNYFHLSFIVSVVRDTCSGINDVGWKKRRRNADGHADGSPDRPLLKVMTSRRQVTDIWMFVAAAAAAALSGTFISFSCAGSRRGLVSASLRSAFPLLPAQLCTHGFSQRGRKKKGSFAPGMNQLLCFASFVFVVTDKNWVIILKHIHLRLTQAMLALNLAVANIWNENKKSLSKYLYYRANLSRSRTATGKYDAQHQLMSLTQDTQQVHPRLTMFTCWLKTSSGNSMWSVTWWKRDAEVQSIRRGRKWITG